MKIIDCKGFACPKPVILTKKELDAIAEGEIEVIVDNEAARENVSKFAKNEGHECSVVNKEGEYHVIIKKSIKTEGCKLMSFDNKKLVILVGSYKFGDGDEKLGIALMKSYFYALSESEEKPKTMLFVNSGVRLTTEGSEVIESLRVLKDSGVEILSCGTCLDFYGLKEKMIIGEITNMYTIVDRMNNASNTIKL